LVSAKRILESVSIVGKGMGEALSTCRALFDYVGMFLNLSFLVSTM
jgi:hypothetical protein